MAFESATKDGHPRTVLCFFFFGLLTMVYDEITLVSAQDVLAGSSIATTTVVLSIALSVLFMKLTVPWVMQCIPYLVKIVIIVLVLICGLLTLVCSSQIPLRLVGVSIIEAGVSTSEITLMSLTAFYDQITVSAFVAGIGMSSLFGPFYYTALTTWLDLSPRTTMTSTVPWPLLFLVLYALLNKEPIKRASRKEEKAIINEENYNGRTNYGTNDEDRKKIPDEVKRTKNDGKTVSQIESNTTENLKQRRDGTLNVLDKLKTALNIFPFIFFLFVTYFAEYLSNHAVITTLAFPDSSLSPRDHYPYYMLTYHIGKFIGRSHIFLMSCFNPGLLGYVLVRRTWILAIVAVVHLVVFFLLSWYRFLPHLAVVIVLCITEGFTAGSMYVNSVHAVSESIKETKQKEFALGLLTVGDALGKLVAGVAGLWQEPFLRRHCLEELNLGVYCFTRHVETGGWTD